jgi:ABC-2 type transport system ATP-binding protein
MQIIETKNLSKSFADTIAVDNVSLHVKKGEIYGFLGLNGAGKTTTIKLLLGIIKQDKGSCFLFGEKPKQATDIWNEVGYLVETPHSYPNLSVIENLELIYRLRGLKDRKLIKQIIDKLHLTPYQDKKEQSLSMGNKQRLGLAKALIHRPQLLILDEPINGLDPAGIVEVREFLQDLTENQNTTIFISSHILSEIARLATRLGIIHNGKLVKEIDSTILDKQLIKKLTIDTVNNRNALELLKKKGFKAKLNENSIIELSDLQAINHPERIATELVNSQIPPKHLNIYEEDLETYFLRTIKK